MPVQNKINKYVVQLLLSHLIHTIYIYIYTHIGCLSLTLRPFLSHCMFMYTFLYINNKIGIVLLLLQCEELPTQCQGNLAYSSLTANEDNVFIEASTLHVQMYTPYSNLLLLSHVANTITTTTKHLRMSS